MSHSRMTKEGRLKIFRLDFIDNRVQSFGLFLGTLLTIILSVWLSVLMFIVFSIFLFLPLFPSFCRSVCLSVGRKVAVMSEQSNPVVCMEYAKCLYTPPVPNGRQSLIDRTDSLTVP
jgi:hypothetical protein